MNMGEAIYYFSYKGQSGQRQWLQKTHAGVVAIRNVPAPQFEQVQNSAQPALTAGASAPLEKLMVNE